MAISGIGGRNALNVQSLIDMRVELDDLQRQLGTGKRAETYAGLGIDRGLAVGLRAQLAAISGYGSTMESVSARLNVTQTALGQIGDSFQAVKALTLNTPYALGQGGQTTAQATARAQLDQLLGALNTRAGDIYIFSGKSADQPAVETLDHILNGDGAGRAGLKQMIAERNQADLGTGGLGRLVLSTAGAVLSVAEDVAGSPFGFKLSGLSRATAGGTMTTSPPSGSPASLAIDFGANPASDGESFTFTFRLPDGTSETVTLKATSAASPGANQFAIGATPAATAANLQAALTAAVATLAQTALSAASAVAAANDFFAAPPQRVSGPPFDTATSLVNGTNGDTVSWYTGEAGTDPARATAMARIDQTISIAYGLRANEEAIRWGLQNVAVFAAMSFSSSDAYAPARYAALTQRVSANLNGPAGMQRVSDIETDIANAQTAMKAAQDRHAQVSATLTDLLQSIEGAPTEEVAAKILSLQTRLQASLQTTALLARTSLVNLL